MSFPGEQTFNSKCDIKYLYQKPKTESKNLIVIFSAFSAKGKPPAYNYVKTLSEVDSHKLFILDDYGPRASYYLGENRDYSIRDSVISLIDSFALKLDIGYKNIIAVGSSKGGYASLYFGFKYGFGHVIVAAPQTALGNYLFNSAIEVAEYIAGGIEEEDKIYLNDLLGEVVTESSNSPSVHIHVGDGDRHYKNHVLPFTKLLANQNIEYNLDIGDYEKHADVGIYFPELLLSSIKEIADLEQTVD